jgi:hypothetical protein
LDADEALDDQLKKSILQVKGNWKKDGYYMNRLTNYCGKWINHCGWYPDKKLRLWDSRKGHWTGINPHDKYELHTGDGDTAHIKGDILHYSFYTIEQHLKQVDYFTTISSKSLFAKGKKAHAFHLIISPAIKFLRDYIFKLGFLDGYYGFIVCKISAKATYMKYAKLKALQEKR